jgi:hypothetical protein
VDALSEESSVLWILTSIALGVFAVGSAASLLAWLRGQGPLAGVCTFLVFGLLHQIASLGDGATAHTLAEGALLGAGIGGFVALRALLRTTRERDRAEDVHWDSMETVRRMTELAAAPGQDLQTKLSTMLALGATRFGLEHAVAWMLDEDGGRALCLHPPDIDEQAIPAERLRQAAQSSRPLTLIDTTPSGSRVFFGTSVQAGGQVFGSLGFAGSRPPDARFAATDKDLVNLMAQWLASELGQAAPANPAPSRPPRPRRASAPRRPSSRRRGEDLNATLRRCETKLRRRLAADATLELVLEPGLPDLQPLRVSLPALVESLVDAAVRLAPAGRIQIRTAALAPARADAATPGSGDVTLSVSVEGAGIDPDSLARIFENPADGDEGGGWNALPLAQLERMLRQGGADLSVSLEPPRRASLTAFVPPRARGDALPSQLPTAPQPS